MNKQDIAQLKLVFDGILKTMQGTQIEFCYARDLMKALGYNDWKNFIVVVDKAKYSCKNSKVRVSNHFSDVGKMVKIGSDAERKIKDIILTRYACYLIAQNGDSRKAEIAFLIRADGSASDSERNA